jgi:hypothetical protein
MILPAYVPTMPGLPPPCNATASPRLLTFNGADFKLLPVTVIDPALV